MWTSFVRTKATNLEIWDLVNPVLPTRLITYPKLIELIFDPGAAAAEFNPKTLEFCKLSTRCIKARQARLAQFASIISHIQEMITSEKAALIQKTKVNPHSPLKPSKKGLHRPTRLALYYLKETKKN